MRMSCKRGVLAFPPARRQKAKSRRTKRSIDSFTLSFSYLTIYDFTETLALFSFIRFMLLRKYFQNLIQPAIHIAQRKKDEPEQ
jgi:hypothetical protein